MKTILNFFFLTLLSSNLLASESPLASAINSYSLDLQKQMTKSKGDKNSFFSPLSISAALAMTSAGARGNTLKEMQRTLKLSSKAHKNFKDLLLNLEKTKDSSLSIANKLWGQSGLPLSEEFVSVLKKSYDSDLEPLNFAQSPEPSRVTINKWVENKTKNKIKDLIPSGAITPSTSFVITNAIYFKGQWKESFKSSSNIKADFISSPNQKKLITFMRSTRRLNYLENSDYQKVELPYKNDELHLVIILPKEGKKLSQIESTLASKDLYALPENSNAEVEIIFPKFTSEISYELSDLLKAQGMKDAFDSNKADFSAMVGKNSKDHFFISNVLHKAFVEMSEEGTEAAAATAVIMTKALAITKPPIYFNANRPFLYYIRHEATGVILFAGKLVTP